MVNGKYTAGELAKLCGVSVRTIRYYDVKGLLKPIEYSEAGYRYYDDSSINTLQKILMLKYLGFSLEKIIEVINSNLGENLSQSLKKQRRLLMEKREHINLIINAVEEAEKYSDNWESLIKIISLTNEKEEVIKQYSTDINLNKRMNIHDKFSTNSYGWHKWVFDKMKLKENMRILEIGCGNGALWLNNLDRIPKGCNIFLTDYSEGMLEKAKRNIISNNDVKFQFMQKDADNFEIDEDKFDIIISNHVLFYIKNREKLFYSIRRLLKNEGVFYCSTIGREHMVELHNLAYEFDERICIPHDDMCNEFSLENGKEQLSKVFNRVSRIDYEDSLIVDDSKALYDYVYSIPGNAANLIDSSKKDFKEFLDDKIEKEGAIYINKSTGIFKCY